MNRGRGRIKPPRRGLVTDQVSFDEVWGRLAQSIREIHEKNASTLSFEALYRDAYKLVLKKYGEKLYESVRELVAEHLQLVAVKDVKPLVPNVVVAGSSIFTNSAAVEKRIGGERFLERLKDIWEDHQLCMSMITDVLMYMNRIFCKDHDYPTSYAVGMGLFRQHILRNPEYKIGTALNNVILGQIHMEREGDVISHGPIRSCIHMLESLYETEDEIESEKVYLTSFEGEFLDASAEFYESEGQRLLQECDAATYLRKTERRLQEEHDRCVDTISTLTQSKIEEVVHSHLITKNIREVMEMESGINFMLDNQKFEDLKLLYRLVSRVDPQKTVVKEMMCKRLVELGKGINTGLTAGTAALATVANGDPSSSGAAAAREEKAATSATTLAIKWVDDVLALKDRYDSIWERSMDSDKGVQTALTRAFTDFINDLTAAPEYISLFIDDNLRRGIKGSTELEVDTILDKAVTLFRYLREKDVFERHYKNHLSRRLLNNRSLSHDAEKQMIGKLKMEVGVAFTSRLEGMFRDMESSEELTREFRERQQERQDGGGKGIDLTLNVLTTTYWPTKVVGSEVKTCTYPAEVEALRTKFTEYYLGRHSGRKLMWKANMGTADLRATFKGKKHEINVSTYAMVILLAFNDLPPTESLSFTELQTITSIPEEDLIRNLQSLAVAPKTRLLSKTPMSKDVQPTDRFSINDQFTSKFVRFKIGVVAGNRAENDREKKETTAMVEKDRGNQIEAAVVRIMKQRKQLSHQELVVEVVGQLKNRFAPEMAAVKKRIESLIERDYLERVEGKRETYRYLA